EAAPAALEDLDRLAVAQALEGLAHDVLERRDDARVDPLAEEGEVLAAALERAAHDVLEARLGEVHVAGEVAEGHLRLDHPELGEVAARVRVLGAEGRPEGVDARERERRDLGLELPRDGEEGLAREEVAREVDAAVLAERRARGVERGDAEERAGALGVRGGD